VMQHRQLVGLILASALITLDGTATTIALSAIGRDFSAPMSRLQWIVNAPLLVLAAVLLPAGTLADRFGRLRVIRIGLGVFVVASGVCCRVVRRGAHRCQVGSGSRGRARAPSRPRAVAGSVCAACGADTHVRNLGCMDWCGERGRTTARRPARRSLVVADRLPALYCGRSPCARDPAASEVGGNGRASGSDPHDGDPRLHGAFWRRCLSADAGAAERSRWTAAGSPSSSRSWGSRRSPAIGSVTFSFRASC
jgi:hypothetical protein